MHILCHVPLYGASTVRDDVTVQDVATRACIQAPIHASLPSLASLPSSVHTYAALSLYCPSDLPGRPLGVSIAIAVVQGASASVILSQSCLQDQACLCSDSLDPDQAALHRSIGGCNSLMLLM